MHAHAGSEIRLAAILLRFVADHNDSPRALRVHLPRDPVHGQRPVHGLTSGHGDGVVVKDLEGDVGVGRDSGSDRHQPGMEIGAVAHVLKHVLAPAERRLADPAGALGPHLGVAGGFPVHELRQVVAADAGQRAAALRHPGGSAVRTPGAEVRRALH